MDKTFEVIDLNKYPRKDIYNGFKGKLLPYISTTYQVDISYFYNTVKASKLKFFATFSFIIAEAINDIAAFKQRIYKGQLVQFNVIHPGFTILKEDETFTFCDQTFYTDFHKYYISTLKNIEKAKTEKDVSMPEKSHMFFISVIPWFGFTSFTHPYDELYGDIPIITIGKYAKSDNKMKIPIAIQAHHALVDGIHLGKFYHLLQEKLNNFKPTIG